jgi:8-oxo-dGTP pyrophosphatase MutT (NUDIX family)
VIPWQLSLTWWREDPAATARRRCREELGIDVSLLSDLHFRLIVVSAAGRGR